MIFFQALLKQDRKNTNMHFFSQMEDHTLQNHQISTSISIFSLDLSCLSANRIRVCAPKVREHVFVSKNETTILFFFLFLLVQNDLFHWHLPT